MKVTMTSSGNFNHIEEFFRKIKKRYYLSKIEKYAKQGVDALASVTPVDTGLTASSWGYEIHESDTGIEIYWTNSNINDGVNIAVILQYGHGTGTGGYVQGRDYINPAIQPYFDQIAEAAWKEITS